MEKALAIKITEWEAALDEAHDLYEFRAQAVVEYIDGYKTSFITGYCDCIGGVEQSMISQIAWQYNCDAEWVFIVPGVTFTA